MTALPALVGSLKHVVTYTNKVGSEKNQLPRPAAVVQTPRNRPGTNALSRWQTLTVLLLNRVIATSLGFKDYYTYYGSLMNYVKAIRDGTKTHVGPKGGVFRYSSTGRSKIYLPIGKEPID